MKKIIIISSVSLLFFAGSQICGCGSCSLANTHTTETVTIKSESKTVKLKITGMTCAGCSRHATEALEGVKGVASVDLEYPGDVATVKYDSKETNVEELIMAIEKINYKAEEIQEDKVEKKSDEK